MQMLPTSKLSKRQEAKYKQFNAPSVAIGCWFQISVQYARERVKIENVG